MRNNNTKKVKRLSERMLLVTVDVGKVRHTGYLRCPDGSEVKPFDFFNNGGGFQKLWDCIYHTRKSHHLEEVVVGFVILDMQMGNWRL